MVQETKIEIVEDNQETFVDAETVRSAQEILDDIPVLCLGEQYVNGFIKADDSSTDHVKQMLNLMVDKQTGAVRVGDAVPNWAWLRPMADSGDLVSEILQRIDYNPGDVWLDLRCDRGQLFDNVPTDFVKIGMRGAVLGDHSKLAAVTLKSFSLESWQQTGYDAERVKIATCIGTPTESELKDLVGVLADEGLLVMQFNYAPLTIQHLALDNIELHAEQLHSLTSMYAMIMNLGLDIVDANVNDIDGGSIRIYAVKPLKEPRFFGTAQLRGACDYRVDALLSLEQFADITNAKIWDEFNKRLSQTKQNLRKFLGQARQQGETIYALGTDRGCNSWLQFFGLTAADITAIALPDDSTWGLKTLGSEIPVCSPAELLSARPNNILVLTSRPVDLSVYEQAGINIVTVSPYFGVFEHHEKL